MAGRRGGRGLPLGEPVDAIVEHHVGDVDVAPRGVREVAGADREAVAVAPDHHHGEPRVAELDPDRHRQGAAVHPVEPVALDEPGQAAGAADARDQRQVVGIDLQIGERLGERVQDPEVAAAGAPDRLDPSAVVLGRALRFRLARGRRRVDVRRARHSSLPPRSCAAPLPA